MCRALHVSVLSSQEAVRMYIPLYLYYLSGSKPRMHSFETVWWNSRSRFKHCAMHAAIRSPKLSVRDGIISTLRFLRRQLVCQVRPLASHHGAHFIRDVIDRSVSSMNLCRRFRSAGINAIEPQIVIPPDPCSRSSPPRSRSRLNRN